MFLGIGRPRRAPGSTGTHHGRGPRLHLPCLVVGRAPDWLRSRAAPPAKTAARLVPHRALFGSVPLLPPVHDRASADYDSFAKRHWRTFRARV